MLIDSHSHSADSMSRRAEDMGLVYYALTEHYDLDYLHGKEEKFARQLNIDKYGKYIKLKRSLNSRTNYGLECGYNRETVSEYEKAVKKINPDVVISSVHTIDGAEAYFGRAIRGKTLKQCYGEYLNLVLESAKVDYADIIGHFGYITRYAEKYRFFPDTRLYRAEFYDMTDEILKTIIDEGKTLEINTNTSEKYGFLPEKPILERYRQLGGENITFGSDAHSAGHIAEKYSLARDIALSLGYKYWTVYRQRQMRKIKIL